MRTTADYLDALQRAFDVKSDYALRPLTGWKLQQISRYRVLKSSFDDDTAAKVADWLNEPLAVVLLDMNVQRARNERVRREWAELARKLSGAAAAAWLLCLLPCPADAAQSLCIMLSRLRRIIQAIRTWTGAAFPLHGRA